MITRHLAFVGALLLPITVSAQAVPNPPDPIVNLLAPLTDQTGKPIVDPDAKPEKDDPECAKCAKLTLGKAIEIAVGSLYPDEAGRLTLDQQLKRGQLALAVGKETEAHFSADEVTMIEQCIAKRYAPILVARIVMAIDPNRKAN